MCTPAHPSRFTTGRGLALGLVLGLSVGCAAAPRGVGGELLELARFLDAVHPDSYRHLDAAELERRRDAAIVELEAADPGDEMAVGRAVHRIVGALSDGHVMVGLPAFQAERPLSLLPLLPIRVDGRILVDASTPVLPIGTEIVALEGRPIDALWDDLRALVMVDGPREGPRDTELQRNFPRYVHLELGLRSTYRVTLRTPDGETQELILTGIERGEMAALDQTRQSDARWGVQPEPGQPPWPTLTRIDDGTVIMHLPSFGVRDQEGYSDRVDALFASLEGSEELVLDLRGNEGGFRTASVAVLNHLLDRPYAQWRRIQIRTRAIPRRYRARVSFPIAPEAALREFPGERRGEWRVYDGDPLAGLMRPHPSPHTGPVAVFVDGRTSSAAVELLAALLAHREGVTVIGEETRGECGRHTGEIPIAYTTPQLGAVVLLSLAEIALVPVEGCEAGRGFVPDLAVGYTLEDLHAGHDPFVDRLRAR